MLKTILILTTFSICLNCLNKINFDTEVITNTDIKFNWVKQPKVNNASDSLIFSIATNKNNKQLKLLLTNAIGTTFINGVTEKGTIIFTVPKHFSTRAGILNYSLIYHTAKIGEGTISIIADNNTHELESYFGPQHIVASPDDFAMLVTIPTDIYDNPNKNNFYNNEVFKDLIITNQYTLNEIIHYKKIFSKTTKGKVFVKSNNGMIHSKKFEATILASSPIDFKIDFNRNHSIADGKELTTISTSMIKDIYDNVIENGTLVNFKMEGKNTIVTASGKTINGIATTQILHPTSPENFVISAFINGYARSNEITVQYK